MIEAMLMVVVTDWVRCEQVSCSSIGALDWTNQVPGPWSGTSLVAPTDERSPTSAPLAAPTICAEAAGGAIASVEGTDGDADLSVAIALGVFETVGVGLAVVVGVDLVGGVVAKVDVDTGRTGGAATRGVMPRDCATGFGGLETVKTRTSSSIGLDHKTRCAARIDVTRRIMIPRYRRARTVAKLGDVMVAHTRNR